MKYFLALTLVGLSFLCHGQGAAVSGQFFEAADAPAVFATVALYQQQDSSLVKVSSTDDNGTFRFTNLEPSTYYLSATYVGFTDLTSSPFPLEAREDKSLAPLTFSEAGISLADVTVTATRSLVEVKADRTIFNVAGTVNSGGSTAIDLLRKAPGVVVGNNDQIAVLGRSGVLVYVDGKRLPLSGQELAEYLRSLTAEQIDRIEIITSPGAKYEAEGNGGIIDIRLKREENLGLNASLSTGYTQGRYGRGNLNGMMNYRSKTVSLYGNLYGSRGAQYNTAYFRNTLNGFTLQEVEDGVNQWAGFSGRLGMDVFLGKQHTLGFLVSGSDFDQPQRSTNRNMIAGASTPEMIDSLLVSDNTIESFSRRQQINVNYRYEGEQDDVLNFDIDYATFEKDNVRLQGNQYYDATETERYSSSDFRFAGPTTVTVIGSQLDYEKQLPFGRLSLGGKVSQISSDNAFLVYNRTADEEALDELWSSNFSYLESIQGAYLSLSGKINDKVEYSLGLRTEWTQLEGAITVFDPSLMEPPFTQRYRRFFPNAGLSWPINEQHTVGLRYGRRIARPYYGLLSPFRNQLSPLTFSIGNPRLQPEQINNLEFSYSLAQRYHFKIAYGVTLDQITHVSRRDDDNPLARSFSSDNSAQQKILSLNVSFPVEITPGWTTTNNINAIQLTNASQLSNFGETLNIKAFSYTLNHQSTITLPWQLKGEIAGYFNGPGVRGGDIFRAKANWSLDVGLQRKFLREQLLVKVSVGDVFHQAGWGGSATFNGLVSEIDAVWDSRRLNVNLTYSFGNDKVQRRNRSTAAAKETSRVGG